MSLVGDVILSARELMTDLPVALGIPSIVSATGTTGGNFNSGITLFLKVTQLNAWGESLPSTENSVTLSGGQNAVSLNINTLPGTLFVRAYYGLNSNAENFFEQFAASPSGTTIVTVINSPSSGIVPTRSTAYLPDTDGQAVSAYAAYRWFNQALTWAAAKNRGGLPDFGAAGTASGIGNYVLNGYWKKIDNAWYDGYPLGLLSKNNVFRRNPVTGYAGMLSIFQATDRLMVECWPQPSRTSGQTTLASDLSATAMVAILTSTSGFVLGFGLAQIGTELVYYSAISGNTLTGLQRGMCGTTPAIQLSGSSVTELNLMVSGFRVPSTYSVGQAASTLYLPPGWDEALVSYMLYRFRSAEQDDKSAQRYLQEATQKMSDLSANRIIAGPRQIQPYGSQGPDTVAGLGSPFGGVILK
jgi:hypothetical protein